MNLPHNFPSRKRCHTAKYLLYLGTTPRQTLEVEFYFHTEREESIHVSYDEYKKYIKPEACIQIYLKGSVKETRKSYAHYETLALTKPSLKLEVCDPGTH